MNVTATALNKRPGTYLEQAMREPVVIEKSGRPVVVMVSYQRFVELEDAYWGERATMAEKDAVLESKATMEFLQEDK